ncbi:MAG: DUF5666 domain-containing protein, partial [Gammaproteobacteria bacterium]|nr:DUF5666 domain-containing protein [Gammaproteobacteria bacterium]
MRYLQRWSAIVGIGGLVAAFVVACGGGGGTFAGIDRLGVTNGTITGFGSIIVNGVEYETGTGTSYLVDDTPGSEMDLQVGQVVTVRWTSGNNGVTFRADDVSYSGTVRGPIASINGTASSFVVLGQTVLVDAGTSFAPGIIPGDLSGLAVADNVEVSGLIDASGAIRATRVERKTGAITLKVRGTVSAVTATTFSINAQVVNYATAMLEGFPGGQITAGDFVEAKGNSINGSNQLVATEVELEDESLPGGDDGDEAEVEGYVTAFSSASSFSVSGVPVSKPVGVVVTGGTVALNVKVEVEGVFNASGVLVATSIEVKTGSSGSAVNAKLSALVDSVNAGAGQLVVLGVPVSINASTRLEDKSNAAVRPFSLANLSVGNFVEVQGVAQQNGSVVATSLERENPEDEGVLRGPVSAVSNPNLTILGREVATTGSTFEDANDNPIDAATFFATVTIGTEVKVKFL